MRTALLVLVSCATLAACVASSRGPCDEAVLVLDRVPRLAERLSPGKEACTRTMAASAQMWPSYEVVVNGVELTVGVDGDDVVRFVATRDPDFAPPEGLHVGDPAAAAVAAAPAASIVRENGWGHFIQLPSGWYAFLDDTRIDPAGRLDLNLGTRDLAADARVTMFFMRD